MFNLNPIGFIKAFTLWFLLLLSVMPAAAEPVRIAVPEITSLLETDGSGVYQQIFSEALKKTELEVKMLVLPYKRALSVFGSPDTDCVFSFTKVLLKKYGEEKIIYSFPFGAFGYYIFTRKGEPAIESAKDLLGKRVGGTVGHDSYYQHTLPEALELSMVRNDEQSLNMLKLGRIDALIAAVPDVAAYLPELSYSPNHPLVFSYDRLTCKKTAKNQAFLDSLSKVLIQLQADGTYKRIAGDNYLEFEATE